MGLLEDARCRTHDCRTHDSEVLDDLVDATVDRRREPDRQRQRQHHLAEGMRQWQPQEVQVVRAQDLQGVDGGGGIRPRPMREPHTFRPAGGTGRVDDAGQLLRSDAVDAVVHRIRGLGEQSPAECLEFGESQHPVAVALTVAVEDHDLVNVGQFGAACDQLVDLGLILGHHDAASRIGDDECDVVGVGGRVDRGRGGTRAHHGEVDENPFVPRRRCQRDPVLGGDAQRDQPSRDQADAIIDLLPGDARPAVVKGVPERLGLRSGRDAIDEQPGDR